MAEVIPAPDYRSLLPPLLACLPTASVSPQPPQTLLSLLSPILRQRVHLLASSASSSSDSWLSLLCWKPEQASKLARIVKSDAFDFHPVSGEIDLGDVEDTRYRRLDRETLQARMVILRLGLTVVYLWCQGEPESSGDGWLVAEILPSNLQGDIDHATWFSSISDANGKSGRVVLDNTQNEGLLAELNMSTVQIFSRGQYDSQSDDDDNYWAQYDSTLRSPLGSQPATTNIRPLDDRANIDAETEYFSRYDQVQPDLDKDNPSKDPNTLERLNLEGEVKMVSTYENPEIAHSNESQPNQPPELLQDGQWERPDLTSPEALPSLSGSAVVPRLEESAALHQMQETAVRQHIGTTIKSLYRLSQNAGINRQEFSEFVQRELDTLSLIDPDGWD